MLLHRTRRHVAQALVEFALVVPLVIGLTLGVLQLVLYAHARDVVIGSVQEAARLSAEDGRGLDEGYARARALITAGTRFEPGLTVDQRQHGRRYCARADGCGPAPRPAHR